MTGATHHEARQTERQELIDRLGAGFMKRAAQLYLVGGAVRDELLGRAGLDLDFATSARPETTRRILEELTVEDIYTVGEKFGTIGARERDYTIEITTYRSGEAYPIGSRKPAVEFGRSLQQDLTRRDFTINAIARDTVTGELVDPFGGVRDLGDGRLRAVGAASDRFREDPLRLLRAVRLAASLGFAIDDRTWQALQEQAPGLEAISRERIRDEYSRMLEGPAPARALTLLSDGGLLAHSVPQLLELTRMEDHGPRHPLSLWEHTMRVVEGVPARLALRWAALLHDIAKPVTRTEEPSGRPRFFHHEELAAHLAREVLASLRYSNRLIDDVVLLVETHMQPHSYSAEWSDGAVRRFMLRLGPLTEDAMLLGRADAAGHTVTGRPPANASKFDALEARIRVLSQEPAERLHSPLTGDDLMARYGRPPGPWIRRIKDALTDEVLEGRLRPEDVPGAWRVADALVSEPTWAW